MNGAYAAGLWLKELKDQLGWRVLPESIQEATRPSSYQAPSWPWAPLDGEVNLLTFYSDPHMFVASYVLDICLVAKGPDSLGELSSSCLRLSCDMLMYAEFLTTGESWDILLRSTRNSKGE